jgi:hypothetical protein
MSRDWRPISEDNPPMPGDECLKPAKGPKFPWPQIAVVAAAGKAENWLEMGYTHCREINAPTRIH